MHVRVHTPATKITQKPTPVNLHEFHVRCTIGISQNQLYNSIMTTTLMYDAGHDNHMYVGEINTNGEIPQSILLGHDSSVSIGKITSTIGSNSPIAKNDWLNNPYVVGIVVTVVGGILTLIIWKYFERKKTPKIKTPIAFRVESGSSLEIENVGFRLQGNSEAIKVQGGSKVRAKNVSVHKSE